MRSAADSRIIVVAAASADSVSRIRRAVERAVDQCAGLQLVNCVLVGSQLFVPREGVCGAVLELDRSAMTQPRYCSFLKWCLHQVEIRDEFRLWMAAGTNGEAAEADIPVESQKTLDDLADTVQRAEGMDLGDILQQLTTHVEMIEGITKRNAWRRLRVRGARILGVASMLVQIVCFAVGVATVLWLPIWDPRADLGPYRGWEGYLAVICGIAGLPCFLLLIYAYIRYGSMLVGMFSDPRGVMYAAVASLVGPPIILLPWRIHAPLMWIVLGALLGCMVDSVRRMSGRMRRAAIPLGPKRVTKVHERLPVELRSEYTAWLSPWRVPLLPVRHPSVFISYSRSSDWGRDVVRALCTHIDAVGASLFTDMQIAPGENWRRRLNEKLSDSTIVLAVMDEQTVQREWPASEIESALRGRRLAGLPEIIAIVSPDMPPPTDESWRWLPVFRELLRTDSRGRHSLEVIPYDANTAQALSFRLHTGTYRSISMIPSPLARIVEGPWQLVKAIMLIWAAACGVAGHVAILTVAAGLFGFDSGRWLAGRQLCGVALLAAAAWAFAALRHALGSRFEFIDKRARGALAAHRDAAVGLVVLIALWWRYLTPAQVLWAMLASYASYVALDEFWIAKTGRVRDQPGERVTPREVSQ